MSQDLDESDDGAILDLLFIQDATASMGDYIESAKKNIVEICCLLRASGRLRQREGLQVGLLAYRDYPAEENGFVVQSHAFTYDMDVMEGYLALLEAEAGGDLPEAFSTALEYAYTEMTGWRDEALKVIVVITDAAPHGIDEKYDSFPDGAPDGTTVRDPIELVRDMAIEGYSIFTLACEPTLGSYTEYAIDFYKALSSLSLGTFCPLTDHKLLVACIIGSLLERIDLNNLSSEYQAEIARQVLEDGLSIDEVIDKLQGKLTSKGQKVTTLQAGNIYNNLYPARHNYNVFMSSASLTIAKKSLKRVYTRRHNPGFMKKIRENEASAGNEDVFSTAMVRFLNRGSHRIVLQLFDADIRRMCEDIIIPNNFTKIMKFKINVPFNFVLVCGRKTKNFSRTFDNEQDIDVDQLFQYS